MRLHELMAGAAAALPSADVEIAALAYDDRRVRPGTLFFCVPGFARDGHDFAPAAVERGAAALVVERPLGLG
ncbi:MAG: Mur ligase domain-containing protein, partial [Conexibacter sp.]